MGGLSSSIEAGERGVSVHLRHANCCSGALSPIKEGLQQWREGCDGSFVQAPPDDASKFDSQCVVQRFGLSGVLAHSYVVSSSEEEDRLFRHSCCESFCWTD